MIVRWDDVQAGQDIGEAAGALNVCLRRLQLAREEVAPQADPAAEEIVFIAEGSGSWEHGDGSRRFVPAIASCDLLNTKVTHFAAAVTD